MTFATLASRSVYNSINFGGLLLPARSGKLRHACRNPWSLNSAG